MPRIVRLGSFRSLRNPPTVPGFVPAVTERPPSNVRKRARWRSSQTAVKDSWAAQICSNVVRSKRVSGVVGVKQTFARNGFLPPPHFSQACQSLLSSYSPVKYCSGAGLAIIASSGSGIGMGTSGDQGGLLTPPIRNQRPKADQRG